MSPSPYHDFPPGEGLYINVIARLGKVAFCLLNSYLFVPRLSANVDLPYPRHTPTLTAIECWNNLKYEIGSIIDKFVPLKKQGKRSRKKHLSKEAIRKTMFKQTMWRVYRRTRKDEDYANYKEALYLATTEIRKSKRTFEKKLAGNIKNYDKSFYAYVTSKQKVQDKVRPLENNKGNIISDGFQMAEVLNKYFSSVFTTEDISSLPAPFTKF